MDVRAGDRTEIEQLLYEYCRALDAMELDAVVSLFAEDASVSYGPDPAFNSDGRDALKRDLARMWRFRRTFHQLSAVQVRFIGEHHATAVSRLLAWHEMPDGAAGTLYGQYDDELVRRAGRWVIQRRRLSMAGNDPGYTGRVHPLVRQPPPPGWIPSRL